MCKKVKDINLFYKHVGTIDKHLGKCIDCVKDYDRKRYYDPKSRKKIIEYEKKRALSPERREKSKIYLKKRRVNNPDKYKAYNKVNNAVRDGKLNKLPCIICGNPKSEGHHKDYRKQLDVIWLCRVHHKIEHGKIPF